MYSQLFMLLSTCLLGTTESPRAASELTNAMIGPNADGPLGETNHTKCYS